MEMELPLTEIQENVLCFAAEFIEENNYPPTIEEIQDGVKLSNPGSVYRALQGLENKNYIHKKSDVARGLRLTKLGEKYMPSNQANLPEEETENT